MANFFSELRRRHVYRVGAAYVVVAWVLAQAVDLVTQIYAPPAWIPQVVVAVLASGLPIALVVAWMMEGKAHEAVASAVRSKNPVVDWMLIGALVVVMGLMSYQQLSPTTGARTASVAPASGSISVAVLPFVNLSSDKEQEFFSDGMTEELTSALAKIPDLIVIGRTSAFQFKGRSEDLRAIGQALNASYLIEGSVRRAADRVRITAQLIRADSGRISGQKTTIGI